LDTYTATLLSFWTSLKQSTHPFLSEGTGSDRLLTASMSLILPDSYFHMQKNSPWMLNIIDGQSDPSRSIFERSLEPYIIVSPWNFMRAVVDERVVDEAKLLIAVASSAKVRLSMLPTLSILSRAIMAQSLGKGL